MPKKAARRNTQPQFSKKTHATGLFFILMNVFFWGLAPPIIKYSFDVISPQAFLYYRFVIVMLLTTPFLFIWRKKYNTIKHPRDLLQLLIIGFLAQPLSLGLLFVGLQYTTSWAAAIIAGTAPLFIIIASAIFLKEKITRYEVFGAILGTIGMVLIVLDTPQQIRASNPLLGNALILSQNFVWTIAVLAMKKLAHKHEPFLFGYTGWLTAMIVMGAVTLFTDPVLFFRPLMLFGLPQALLPILYMAIFGSVIAFTAYQIAQKYLPASQVSIFAYLQPVVAIPLSLFWLRETLGPSFILGSLILIVGVVIAEFHSKSRLRHLSAARR